MALVPQNNFGFATLIKVVFNLKKNQGNRHVCSNKRFNLHCEKYVQEKFKVLLQEKFKVLLQEKFIGFVTRKIQRFVASFEVEARSELANLTWKPILLYLYFYLYYIIIIIIIILYYYIM